CLAVVVAVAVGGLFVVARGGDPGKVYEKLITGAVGNTYSQAQTIGKATPLLLVALGVCIAFRCNVLNIGVEGQVIVGGLATTACAIAFQNLPGLFLIALSLLTGFIPAALCCAIPGV